MIKINGTVYDAANQTLREYLTAAGYDEKRVAVERNGAIVPKADYADTILADGDEIEVVSFVGGG
ncbi:MAG: sulfur carrier protein ThiS [Clostridiales bacterium]|nr:sulfur carrier protein ThiS [Clostridiales bacterium]